MSSASESPEGHERAAPSREEAQRAGADGLPLLDEILQQTLRRPDQPRPQVADELAALAQVARRYPDQALTVQPILEELIDAILAPQLAAMSLPPAAKQGMVAELARTLYDDSASRERLEALWNSLLEKKP
ncbi:MAG TPA: hypothetical protein VG826_20545 [Pirellulales bacterium]|nr:hypothetical protein [Pirellulales bacterium]